MTSGNIKVPENVLGILADLMVTAENALGAKKGAAKKAWVKEQAKGLISKLDIKAVPDWIEQPIYAVIIDTVIDVLWWIGADKFGRNVTLQRGGGGVYAGEFGIPMVPPPQFRQHPLVG